MAFTGPQQLEGTVRAGGFCGSNTSFAIHFALEFDRPFAEQGTWLGGELRRGSTGVEGLPCGAWVGFAPSAGQAVQMKIGLSYVSIENARENLRAENPGWDFDAVRANAGAAWHAVLNRIQIEGGRDEDRLQF